MGRYFGTDGFRGEANVELNAEHAYRIGRFLGWYFRNSKSNGETKIVIGKDTRKSGYMFEYSLVAGLTASGADAYLLHVTTTPSVSYITKTDGLDCGIMISASHNPFYDNGIKVLNGNGEKLDDETTSLIEDYLDGKAEEIPFATGCEIGKTVDYVSGRNRYIAYLISLGLFSLKGKRIALDCANGSSWSIAKSVFDSLGAQTFVINAKPDGLNINLNCGSTHIESLREFVLENKCDVGFAYDGDADRCLCVDEKGSIITGDHIMYICARYLKEKGALINNTVVTTVMSNIGLYKALDEIGVDYAVTPVGDKNVYDCMAKNGFIIGGEESGHIIFSKYASTGDGILTSLKLTEVMLSTNLPLSKLAKPMKLYPQVLYNLKVNDKKAAVNAAYETVSFVQNALGDSGRVLVRESGTEPVIRIMVEAQSEEECRKYADMISESIRTSGVLAE